MNTLLNHTTTFNGENEDCEGTSCKEEDRKDEDEDSQTESNSDRPKWDNKFQYIMAALGFAVGLGNIWRFPYLCHKNGGGAFLIPYFLMLFLEGYPLYYLELAVGQKIRKGAVGVWCHIDPHFAGVGFASIVVSLFIALYYNMILAWSLYYFGSSFRSKLLWADCPVTNGTVVRECELSSSTSYYWYRSVLDISYKIDDGWEINGWMVLVLFIAWFLVFLGMIKGIKSSGKVMYFSTLFPYIILIAFFIRGMTLEGAAEGVKHMFKPDVSRLSDATVWREAATQIFFSLGLGYGAIIAYSSYNPIHNNCKKDALFIATANSITSVFACVIVFSILGHKAHLNTKECTQSFQLQLESNFPESFVQKNSSYAELVAIVQEVNKTQPDIVANISPIPNCSLSQELKEIGQGTGLAFIAFAEAILSFPGAPVWAVLFFFMLLNIGMTSEFGILQGFVTTVLDSEARISKFKLTASFCSVMFLLGLIFTTRSGSYMLDVFDSYSATFGLTAVALFETIAMSWVYKIKNFEKDIEFMIHQKPGRYWRWSWKFTCPLIMAVILISSFIDLVRTWPGYEGWNSEMAIKVELPYPWWTLILIYFLILCSLLCIPLVALLYKVGIFDPKRFGGSRYGVSKRDEMPNDDNVADSAQPLDPC